MLRHFPSMNSAKLDAMQGRTMEKYGKTISMLGLFTSLALIAYLDFAYSPTIDEPAHLVAGCRILLFGDHELYKVNPPLPHALCAVPVVFSDAKFDWRDLGTGGRSEWLVGDRFLRNNGRNSFRLLGIARLALASTWIIAAVVIYSWATSLYGRSSGVAAMWLWCFNPSTLTAGASLCTDCAATAFCVLAVFSYRETFRDRSVVTLGMAGMCLGLAVLCKTSMFFLFPVLVFIEILQFRRVGMYRIGRLALLFCVALVMINWGYGFQRTLTPLRDFAFYSEILSGKPINHPTPSNEHESTGNRFKDSWLGSIPVPIPGAMLEGIDLQKFDFEHRGWSYLSGHHQRGGWWFWYAYALLVKTPVGTLLLGAVAVALMIGRRIWWRIIWQKIHRQILRRSATSPQTNGSTDVFMDRRSLAGHALMREHWILLTPAVCIFLLVSSQTGFSRYPRYVLPCYPFAFIWISQIFSATVGFPVWLRKCCWGLLVWSVMSSLSVFPFCLSYFNELAGGPQNGPAHLIDSSIDWGQDLLFLSDWINEHPNARPINLSLYTAADPVLAGIQYTDPPYDPRYFNHRKLSTGKEAGPRPGWYAISVHHLYSRTKEFAYLFDFPKTDMVGYSIYIYHLTNDDVAKWNTEHPTSQVTEGEAVGAEQ